MANRIEPPVLLSRLMTFVLATALVAAVALVITLLKLYPLERTQVFFLTTQPRDGMEIRLTSFAPTGENIEIYKQAFIKEYIKARNEIIPNAGAMRRKWANGDDGIVYVWSAPDVYAAFMQTQAWNGYMKDLPDYAFTCRVEFTNVAPRQQSVYAVSFRYFCTNNNGQGASKDYTIAVKLAQSDMVKWSDRLVNPLGIRVTEYYIENGDGDPLDFR